MTAVTAKAKKQRRCASESGGLNIQPFRKKPKISDAVFLPEDDERKL